uniref:Uncharacterized protein n=1 Tax=Anguilla anguilla TaxID=7936 RepID=A0A0E9SXF8_ANGAN
MALNGKNEIYSTCVVYLRKSISFAHLQINRYNGIANIDFLKPPALPSSPVSRNCIFHLKSSALRLS